MSDGKFSCPQCGQHIAADDSWAGRQIQCPSCQASITVPKLAVTPPPVPRLNVASAPPLPPVIPRSPAPFATAPAQSKRGGFGGPLLWVLLGVGLVGVVVLGIAGVAFYRGFSQARERAAARQWPNNQSKPPVVTPGARAPVVTRNNAPSKPADPRVTTDPGTATIPDAPVTGTIRDQDFKPDAAVITSMNIVLKQGKEFFPDASLTFFLFLNPQDKLDGRKIIIAPDDTTGMRPHIHVARKTDPKGVPRTEIVTANYALRLEFGERQGNKLPGRIYLEMGQSLGTKVAGTFEATVAP